MVNQFKKYKYLGQVIPEVPKVWENHILDMLSELDKLSRPKFVSKGLLNFLSSAYPALLRKFIPNIQITQIKQKFATLRITGTFNKTAQSIINNTIFLCNNTCEFCGNPNTTHVTVKSWVRNLCSTCKEVKKYGTNN